MCTVLQLGFSSQTALEWDFSKWLTLQADAFFLSSVLADSVLCDCNACGEGILLFHIEHEQPSGRAETAACGSEGWIVGGLKCGWGKKEGKGGQEWRAGGERSGRITGTRMENSALFLGGTPVPQQCSEQMNAAQANRDGEEKGGDEGT